MKNCVTAKYCLYLKDWLQNFDEIHQLSKLAFAAILRQIGPLFSFLKYVLMLTEKAVAGYGICGGKVYLLVLEVKFGN